MGCRESIKLKQSLLLNEAPCREDVWDSGGMAPHILGLGTGWGRVLSYARPPMSGTGCRLCLLQGLVLSVVLPAVTIVLLRVRIPDLQQERMRCFVRYLMFHLKCWW
jgi:hypothetical protein